MNTESRTYRNPYLPTLEFITSSCGSLRANSNKGFVKVYFHAALRSDHGDLGESRRPVLDDKFKKGLSILT